MNITFEKLPPPRDEDSLPDNPEQIPAVSNDNDPPAPKARWLRAVEYFANRFGVHIKDKSDDTFFPRKRHY